MKKRLMLIFISGFILMSFCHFFETPVYSQTRPLTLGQVTTSLNISNDKKKESAITAKKVRQVGVTFPLTPEIEAELRNAGATDELIEAVRQNSPSPPKPLPVSSPTPIASPIPLPTSTPKPSYTVFFERGNDFFNSFDFSSAIEEYSKALLLDPENFNALVQRGYAHHYKGDSNFDFADYNSAIKINPSLASAPEMLCVLYDSLKDNADDAIENCDKAISAKPNFSLFYYKRANAYRQRNDLDKAISDYDEAIKLYPNFYVAYVNRGRILAAKLDYDKAVADFDKSIAINPKNSSGFFARGQIYRAKKVYEKAFADFNKILEIEPKNAAAVYLERGFTYQAQDASPPAENEFNKAIEFDPKMAAAYNARGWLYFMKSKDDQAILDYTKAIELSPKYGTAYFNRAFVYERKKQYDRAITDLDKAIEINPKSSWAYNNRGLYYFRRGDYARALEDYNKAIEIEPNSINYRNRAIVYEKLGQKDLAQSDRNSAINTTNRIKITQNKGPAMLTSSFAGKIYDKNKISIYNAQIVITNTNTGNSAITRTDKNGRFVKAGLTPGRYKIEISAPGYKTKTVDYPLYIATKIENVNPFILEPEDNPVVKGDRKDTVIIEGSLAGQIFNKNDKKPIPNATVLIINTGNKTAFAARTDSLGQFLRTSLPRGQYRIEISAPGYIPFVVENSLFASKENILLHPVFMTPTASSKQPQ